MHARGRAALVYWVAGVCLFWACADEVHAELPKGKDPKAYTFHDYVRDSLEFNRKTIVEGYREAGKKDAKWDADAVAALESLSRYFTYNTVHPIYAKQRVSGEELKGAAKAALDKGCDDPMVLYAMAIALVDAKESEAALPYLKRAFEGIGKSKYHPYRVFAVALKFREHTKSAEEQGDAYLVMRDMSVKMTAGPFVNGVHRRRTLELMEELCNTRGNDIREQLWSRMQKHPGVDPWVLNVWAGTCYVQRAWAARGSGFANTVTEEGWKSFFDNLQKAKESLVKAWELHPDLPDAATHMITVAMGGGERLNETPRKWFERAVSAQLDDAAAYDKYMHARLPRWGGNYNEIYAVGREALETERFDTLAPWQFVEAVQRITKDSGDWRGWQDAGIRRTVADLCEKYAEACEHLPYTADWYRSFHAAMEWRMGNMAEARRVLDGVSQANEGAFQQWGGQAVEAVGMIYAMTGLAEKHVKKGLRLEGSKDYAGAAEAYKAAAEAVKPEDRESVYIAARAAAVERMVRFDKGDWLDILPKPDFAGWSLSVGDARVSDDGKSVALVADGTGVRLIGETDFGLHYEVHATVEFPKDQPRTGAMIAVDFGDAGATHTVTLINDGTVRKQTYRDNFETQMQLGATNTVTMEFWEGLCRAKVNGNLIKSRMFPTPRQNRSRVAIYNAIRTEGSTVVFKELKVRKLTERPKDLFEDPK